MRSLFALLLPHLIFCSDDKENTCSICYDKMNFELNDTLKTECGHDFHTDCLAGWTNINYSCPLCRSQFPYQLTQNEKNHELRESAIIGDLPKVQEMIAQGADVNSHDADDYFNWTPLLCAATDVDDQTALMTANKTGIAEVLLSNGAAVDARDKAGRTALMKAVVFERTGLAEVLLSNGAAVDARSNVGQTALMYAAYFGKTGLVEVLLSNGAAVDSRNDLDQTALMKASYYGQTDFVKVLLGNGANIDAKIRKQHNHNWTPLMFAAQKGRTDVVKLLLERGAVPYLEPELHEYDLKPEIKELIESKIIIKSYLNELLNLDQN